MVARGDAGVGDLVVLTALLVLTAFFGRPFSKLGVPSANAYVTEVALALILGLALWRCGARGFISRVRKVVPLAPLLLLWLAGAIAAVRGLQEFGLSLVVHDIALVEYSIFIPLVAVAADSRAKATALVHVLLVAGAGATVVFAIVFFFAADSALGPAANPGVAVGLYIALFVLLAVSRLAHGVAVGRLELVLATAALVLLSLMVVRSVFVALVSSLAVLVLFAPRGRRLFAGVVATACLIVSIVGATALERAGLGAGLPTAPEPVRAEPDFVADDAMSSMTGGMVVTGDAADGRYSREIAAGAVFQLAALAGLRPGRPYTVSFSVKPLVRRATSGRVGDTSGAGWSGEVWVVEGKTAWQRVQAVLTPTAESERLVIFVDSGAPRVRVDAVEVREGQVGAEKTPSGQAGGPRGQTPGESAPSRPPAPAESPKNETPPPAPAESPKNESPPPAPAESPGNEVQKPGLFVAAEETFDDDSVTGFASNMQWRLAIWRFMLAETVHRPILGVGFGKPTAFRWNGVTYDARRRDPQDPNDVTGPHNSFVNLLYRTGLLGFVAFLALFAIAAVRGLSWLRAGGASAERAHVVGLSAIFAFAVVVASFSVALEGPFMGMFFWTTLGLLLVLPRLYAPRVDDGRPADR